MPTRSVGYTLRRLRNRPVRHSRPVERCELLTSSVRRRVQRPPFRTDAPGQLHLHLAAAWRPDGAVPNVLEMQAMPRVSRRVRPRWM